MAPIQKSTNNKWLGGGGEKEPSHTGWWTQTAYSHHEEQWRLLKKTENRIR